MDKNSQVITAPFIEGIKACLSDGTQIRRQCSVATKYLVSQLFELIRHKQKLSIPYVFTNQSFVDRIISCRCWQGFIMIFLDVAPPFFI